MSVSIIKLSGTNVFQLYAKLLVSVAARINFGIFNIALNWLSGDAMAPWRDANSIN